MSQATEIHEAAFSRVIGVHDSGVAGATYMVLAGIHGNEPAGVYAMHRVLGRLAANPEHAIPIRGRFVALAGNLAALEKKARYIHRDLNREWIPRTIDRLYNQDPERDNVEDREQRELLDEFDDNIRSSDGRLLFHDLHSSSGGGPPFNCVGDTRANRRIARNNPLPMILGLEECLDGTVLEYFSSQGLVCIASEGGQHDHPRTIDTLEACIWLAMESVGMLADADFDLKPYHDTLRHAARRLPRVLEVRHRQPVRANDGFVMRPGFESLDQVSEGQLLARNNNGDLTAPEWGRILLPLYQGQGVDGFFICRRVNPFWLKVATVLRVLKLDRIAHWLPGVERHADDTNTLFVNPRLARWHVTRLFQLLGFREGRPLGGKFVFTRRRTVPEGRRLRG